jgi:hypothetical protein
MDLKLRLEVRVELVYALNLGEVVALSCLLQLLLEVGESLTDIGYVREGRRFQLLLGNQGHIAGPCVSRSGFLYFNH